MDLKRCTKQDRLYILLSSFKEASATAKNSTNFFERETAREWLNSHHGRLAAFLTRQLDAKQRKDVPQKETAA